MPVKHILIVGGGTAGWLTAAYLQKTLGAARGITITLVESPEIGILGVGEGTFPSIRGALAAIGIAEPHFMRACNASFKQGVKFVNWVRPPGEPGAEIYFHPFNQPSKRADGPELLPAWLQGAAGEGVGFAEAATLQKRVVDAARAPKRFSDADYQGPMNYAYHFDAVQFAALLCAHAEAMGVRRILSTVRHVQVDESGQIAGVVTESAGTLTADLYIDCTGFRAALIGGALGEKLCGVAGQLFVDRAVAIQVPYQDSRTPIASCTLATAQEAGWIWDIGLHGRRGTGYAYASRYTDAGRAESVLRSYIGAQAGPLAARHLHFETGYRRAQWIGNCVSVGLSAGFLEPLESSGIGLIESAAYLIAHLFPADGDMRATAALFNGMMTARYARVVDFLKLHYAVTKRRDTPFWADNADPASWSADLAGKLAMWRCRPPHRLDFVTDHEMYLPASWQFVLYGMEFPTRLPPGTVAPQEIAAARREFVVLREISSRALRDLPDHRDLLDQIYAKADPPLLAQAG